jgi:hypothetical protein
VRTSAFVFALLLLFADVSRAQVGDLIWEDEFDDLDNWLTLTGNGYWGWGNGELEYYRSENVDIAPVPGEPGNNALRIVARQESGPGIVDQWGNPLNYTSGKVSSQVVRVDPLRHDRGAREDAEPRPRGLAGGVAARHVELRLAAQGRDRHDGDGMDQVLPRPARHAQRRQRAEQLHREPDDRCERALLLRCRAQPRQPFGRRQPGVGSRRRLLPPLLQLHEPAGEPLPDLPPLLGRESLRFRPWSTTASSTTSSPSRSARRGVRGVPGALLSHREPGDRRCLHRRVQPRRSGQRPAGDDAVPGRDATSTTSACTSGTAGRSAPRSASRRAAALRHLHRRAPTTASSWPR